MCRLLLVGWDAADWKVIDPLLKRGEMPNLARVTAQGVRGNLATNYPALSPMLWTSIATGKRPPKHGIHGFIEPAPEGMGVRPVSILSRKTKAVWNILNQEGRRSIVAGWWPSHPAEPIRGAMVSNLYPPTTSTDPAAPMLSGTVSPLSWHDRLAELRVHGIEITSEILRMFVPDLAPIDQEHDKSLHDLAGIIAETMSIHSAATELMEHEPWDFAAVYYSGIDHFSHRFMRFHAGKIQHADGASSGLLDGIVANAYRYHDLMLGRLLELAGDDCGVMVMSDHGFHSDRLLPDYIPAEPAGPAIEHRHFGMFAMRAPGVRRNQRVYGANILDIAPTVLHLFGLPAGSDMDGKVLVNAFTKPSVIPAIPSWDDVPGEDGRHDPARRYDAEASAEALNQLVALGYVAPPAEDLSSTIADCLDENRYNLARAHQDAAQPHLAEEILRRLVASDPEQLRYYTHLIQALVQQDKLAECESVLDAFDKAADEFGPRALRELEERRAVRDDHELGTDRQSADARERHERQQLHEKSGGFGAQRMLLRCRIALASTNDPEKKAAAAELLGQIAGSPDMNGTLALFLADGFDRTGDPRRALEFARKARRLDVEAYEAMTLEARIHFSSGDHDKAINAAVESLSLVYFQPFLHYMMGLSLLKVGEPARAREAFSVALSQAPGLAVAHDRLAELARAERRIGDAAVHAAHAVELRRRAGQVEPSEQAPPMPEMLTVVTGFPKDGASILTRMLTAGGGVAPSVTLPRALAELSPDCGYRVVFVNHAGAPKRAALKLQTWLVTRPGTPVLRIDYSETLNNPDELAKKLAQFVGEPFDAAAAVNAVTTG